MVGIAVEAGDGGDEVCRDRERRRGLDEHNSPECTTGGGEGVDGVHGDVDRPGISCRERCRAIERDLRAPGPRARRDLGIVRAADDGVWPTRDSASSVAALPDGVPDERNAGHLLQILSRNAHASTPRRDQEEDTAAVAG